jgi:hypothetical protein
MGVVRIDDALEQEIETLLKRDENRFRYPSKTAFLNIILHERLLKERKKSADTKSAETNPAEKRSGRKK